MSSWKQTERAIAKLLGGIRVPITGRAMGSAPDIAHDRWSVEVKHRKKLSEWLADAIAQAKASMKPGQVPIVILHESGKRHIDDYVVLSLKDFLEVTREESSNDPPYVYPVEKVIDLSKIKKLNLKSRKATKTHTWEPIEDSEDKSRCSDCGATREWSFMWKSYTYTPKSAETEPCSNSLSTN